MTHFPKNITARELKSALERDGFVQKKKKGGHLIFKHLDGRRIILSYHSSGDTFPPKTLIFKIPLSPPFSKGEILLSPSLEKRGPEPAPACIKQGGDFINQSTFHNVIPAAFLSGNPQLDSCQIHAGMTYCGYLLKITHTFTRRAN